jgi:hypothetical protein
MKGRVAIVRGQYGRNRNKQGGRSYQRIKGMANYMAYGQRINGYYVQQEQRGTWYDQNGQVHEHAAVLGWAKEKVHQLGYEYNYNLLLSTRYGEMQTADFNEVLELGSEISGTLEWRYMVHEDTKNQHAHVLLFRHELMPPEQYKEWQQAMQQDLSSIQQKRSLELGLEQKLEQQAERQQTERQPVQEQGHEIGKQQSTEAALAAQVEQMEQSEELEKSQSHGAGLSL